ncbi:BMP family ABC transporter substrate-binding protein [Streptomyces hirsutus]|uniref:BMP family ABC transporter substrate-binding protein n=1 Tax=Streptomyces hirsutus TaxID=35620 RepID=UPI003435A2C8
MKSEPGTAHKVSLLVRPAVASAWRAVSSRRGRWVAGGTVVVLTAVAGAVMFLGEEPGPPDPRARQYRNVNSCLLTGEQGVTAGTPGASVWAGMQKASLETRTRVNYLPVMGEQSSKNALPHLNSLLQRQCDVVLAVGESQVEVAHAEAGRHSAVHFVVVTGPEPAKSDGDAAEGAPENLTVVAEDGGGPKGLESRIAGIIQKAVPAQE